MIKKQTTKNHGLMKVGVQGGPKPILMKENKYISKKEIYKI